MDEDETKHVSRRRVLQASAGLLAGTRTLLSSPDESSSVAFAGGAAPRAAIAGDIPVEAYILRRLAENGVTKIFGVPGKTCEALYERAAHEGIDLVVTSSDLEAGYAADGYARVAGLGAVAVTYGVGTLSLINAIAGAYAERSPIVVINGGPGEADLNLQLTERVSFSHSSGRRFHGAMRDRALMNNDVLTDLAMFAPVTAFAKRADRADEVPALVDRALATAISEKRPVYIEISKDAWGKDISSPRGPISALNPPTGAERSVARDILSDLRAARRPLVLLGIEVQRYGLGRDVEALVRKLGLPWTTTLLAKSVIPESTPGFIGVYDGAYAPKFVQDIVNGSDIILALGCMFGVQYRSLFSKSNAGARDRNLIHVAEGLAAFKSRRIKPSVEFSALISELNSATFQPSTSWQARPRLTGLSFDERRASHVSRQPVNADEPGLTYDGVMKAVSDMLDESFVAITDTSLSTYPAADLDIRRAQGFFCNALWQSIGFSVGAAVGAGLAKGNPRPLVVCGDGGFQMTVQALSTLAKRNIPAVIIVLDNSIYAIEQFLIDKAYYTTPGTPPRPFLSLQSWEYEKIAAAMGFAAPNAVKVATQGDFDAALSQAKSSSGPFFVRAIMKPHDLPSELRQA